MSTFNCRICGPGTPVHSSGSICGGCGTPLANATVKPRKQLTAAEKAICPGCKLQRRRNKFRTSANDSLICPRCRAEFEPGDDVTFVDSRPHINAEKREGYERRKR